MDVLNRMITTQTIMFLYMVCGVVLRRIKIINENSRPSFVKLLTNLLLPCMILDSFNKPLDVEELKGAALVLAVSCAMCLISYVVGRVIWRNAAPERKGTLLFGTMFSNAGNAGTPIVSLVFGESGVVYASFFMIPVRILLWTMGVSLYVKGSRRDKLTKVLLNPCVVIVFVGVALMLSPFTITGAPATALKSIGDMTGPLAMMIIGASLAEQKPRELLDKDAFLLSAMRLIVMPLIALGALKLIGMDEQLMRVTVILLAMPVAYTTAILAERYNANYHFAGKCVCLSTVLSLFTVPLICMLL